MPTALELVKARKQETKNAFILQRIELTKITEDRSVIGGRVVARNPSTGEWAVETGNGDIRRAVSVASSDIIGKSVKVTINGAIGQIAEMPGFL